jgi:transcription elongation factor GreA
MSERLPMTRAGYEKLEEELRRLKSVERIKIVKEIEIARPQGHLETRSSRGQEAVASSACACSSSAGSRLVISTPGATTGEIALG